LTVWKWLAAVAAAAGIAFISYVGWINIAADSYLRSFDPPPVFSASVPVDTASVRRGDHLVRTRGCRGCHGEDLSGQVMWEFAVAPNLVKLAREESPASLDASIRHGIGRDGRALYSMPSYNFIRLTDSDLLDMVAYLRSQPLVEKTLPKPYVPWQIRTDLALSRDMAVPDYINRVPPLKFANHQDQRLARGEYIAMTTCNECHGLSLRADVPWEDDQPAPDLVIIAGAYPEADFRKLMTTGVAIGERELRMMSGVARSRFAYFTEDEVSDLYLFLQAKNGEVKALLQ
jgi:mono/diheme cytochrome c family protein